MPENGNRALPPRSSSLLPPSIITYPPTSSSNPLPCRVLLPILPRRLCLTHTHTLDALISRSLSLFQSLHLPHPRPSPVNPFFLLLTATTSHPGRLPHCRHHHHYCRRRRRRIDGRPLPYLLAPVPATRLVVLGSTHSIPARRRLFYQRHHVSAPAHTSAHSHRRPPLQPQPKRRLKLPRLPPLVLAKAGVAHCPKVRRHAPAAVQAPGNLPHKTIRVSFSFSSSSSPSRTSLPSPRDPCSRRRCTANHLLLRAFPTVSSSVQRTTP